MHRNNTILEMNGAASIIVIVNFSQTWITQKARPANVLPGYKLTYTHKVGIHIHIHTHKVAIQIQRS